MPVSARKFLFVVNPHAGVEGKEDWLQGIERHFKGGQDSYQTWETTGENDLAKVKQQLAAYQPYAVVSIGGDGTLKTVAEAACETGTAVGMIPAGSANGMARELNLPTAVPDLLKIITAGTLKPLDAVEVNGHFSLHLSDIGLNARMISLFDEGPERGNWGYAKAMLQTMHLQKRTRLQITLDGKKHYRRAAMVIIANGRTYGSGVVLDEESTMNDGLFEVLILQEVTLLKVFRCFIRGRILPGPEVEVLRGKKLLITASRPVPFQVDGEFVGPVKMLEAHILPQAVNMLVPN